MPVHSFRRDGFLFGGLSLNLDAAAHGFAAWPFDPMLAGTAATQGNTKLVGVLLEEGATISGVAVPVTAAGVSMTHAFVGIYDKNGSLLAESADSPSAFQATGWIAVPLTSPYIVPVTDLYYLASAFQGGTNPSVLNVAQNSATSVNYPVNTFPRSIMAQVPAGALPNPAVSAGAFANVPLLAAY